MTSHYDVIVYGTVCLDAIWRVKSLPPPGGYMPILEERKMIGGEAVNTAMALTKWGARVALIGNALGTDEDGDLLRELFARDAPDLDTRFLVTTPEAATPFCLCIATPDGHRTMFGRGFDPMLCSPLDPDLAKSARLFTMDPNAWEPGRQAALVAASVGTPVIAMDYTRDPDICRAAAILVTSTDHIGQKPLDELLAFAVHIRDAYGPTTIITRGDQGCIVAPAGQEPQIIPAYTAPAVIDSTGAGDIFRAGLLYGELQSWDIRQTVRFASAAAALNCGAMGGWGGVRSLDEIAAFQKQSNHPLR